MFRYYITDIMDGRIVGTDSEEVAKDWAMTEDAFVVDTKTGEWLTTDEKQQVKEIGK